MITPEILKVLVWPFVVLVVGILFLFLFKRDTSNLLNRLKAAKWPGGTETLFNYGDADIDKTSHGKEKNEKLIEKVTTEGNKNVKWSNSGNVFWIGHDLMWTIDVIVRGAPRETIIHGLRQSLHHIRSIGLTGTQIETRLRRLLSNAENSPQENWPPNERNKYADEVAIIVGYMGILAESNQANFEPEPK